MAIHPIDHSRVRKPTSSHRTRSSRTERPGWLGKRRQSHAMAKPAGTITVRLAHC